MNKLIIRTSLIVIAAAVCISKNAEAADKKNPGGQKLCISGSTISVKSKCKKTEKVLTMDTISSLIQTVTSGQGIQGEKGEKGDTGATGAKGDKGETADIGFVSVTGTTSVTVGAAYVCSFTIPDPNPSCFGVPGFNVPTKTSFSVECPAGKVLYSFVCPNQELGGAFGKVLEGTEQTSTKLTCKYSNPTINPVNIGLAPTVICGNIPPAA